MYDTERGEYICSSDLTKFKSIYEKYEMVGVDESARKYSRKAISSQRFWNEYYETSRIQYNTGIGQPFVYWDDKLLDISGVTKFDFETQTGTFMHYTKTGKLTIEKVHSYHVHCKYYVDKYSPVNSGTHIPDKEMLEDIYVSAIVNEMGKYTLKIYHNTVLLFQKEDVCPEEYIADQEKATYKQRKPYVRYATKKNNCYENYLYCFISDKEYQLDDSIGRPSHFIEYNDIRPDWSRLENVIYSGKGINIILHLTNSKTSQVVAEFIKEADACTLLDNVLEEDTSNNLLVKYTNNPVAVRFICYCASLDDDLLGHIIMGIPVSELEKGTLNYEHEHRYILDSEKINLSYYKILVRDLYQKCDEKMRENLLPQKLYDNCISHDEMGVYLFQYLRDNFEGKYQVPYFSGRKPFAGYGDEFVKEKELYNSIFQKLAEKEGYKTRWKNELTLFQMIKKEYPDAIYQYHSSWLGRQSLDIYVPSINVGFEYQGQQHYKAVEYFGGENALKYRLSLDEKKRKLCEKNKVKLIEWKYDEPITKVLLKKKMM